MTIRTSRLAPVITLLLCGIIYGAPRTWGIRFKVAFGR
jgi:hypothetical protein